ncbi:MAG: AbrB/MazE/SpoVT family DNA-binding domain-containing protein [Oscillospiraceae bacterium]|nr:AbrB/MazE/SpoVT family DNA-binding domain-containing protein [Oscillospiraceae bacterium]
MKNPTILHFGEDNSITLPKGVCIELGLKDGDEVNFKHDSQIAAVFGNGKECVLCGTNTDVFSVESIQTDICRKCAEEIRNALKS